MKLAGYLLTTLGTVLIVLSLLWGALFPPENRWTDEQAEEHARAGTHFHNVAHPGGHASHKGHRHSHTTSESQVNQEELAAARVRWQESKAALNAAQTQSQTTARWLRYGGATLAVFGVIGLVLNKRRLARNVSRHEHS